MTADPRWIEATRELPAVSREGAWPLGVVALAWVAVIGRALPSVLAPDRGIFVSVAVRLAAGDRLYTDVWDNKEPVLYALAVPGRLAGAAGPGVDLLVELALLAVAAVAAYALMACVADRTVALVLGLGGTPLVLTGHAYVAGYGELPGTSLCLAAVASGWLGRPALAGALTGALLLTRVIDVPVAALALAGLWWWRRDVRAVRRGSAGLVAATVAGAAVLGVRHELLPYLQTVRDNVSYAEGPLAASPLGPFVSHLRLSLDATDAVALATTTGVVAAALIGAGRRGGLRAPAMELPWISALTLVAGVSVLALTGLWPHHAQLLDVPAVMALACLARWLSTAGSRAESRIASTPASTPASTLASPGSSTPLRRTRRGMAALGVAGVVLLLAGPDTPVALARGWVHAPDTWRADTRTAPQARALLALGATGRYARLGLNDDEGHAQGVPHWHLACPHLAQYPWDPPERFRQELACAARTPVLLVSATFTPERDPRSVVWNRFVARGQALIAAHYRCDRPDGLRVCTRIR